MSVCKAKSIVCKWINTTNKMLLIVTGILKSQMNKRKLKSRLPSRCTVRNKLTKQSLKPQKTRCVISRTCSTFPRRTKMLSNRCVSRSRLQNRRWKNRNVVELWRLGFKFSAKSKKSSASLRPRNKRSWRWSSSRWSLLRNFRTRKPYRSRLTWS